MIILMTVLLFSGCSIKDAPGKAKKNLRLSDVSVTVYKPSDSTLALKTFNNVAYADTTKFVYTQEAGVYASYIYHRWDERLASQVKKTLAKALSDAKLYENVVDVHSAATYEYLLEVTINRFEHNVAKDSKVDISITLNLINADTKRSRSYTFETTKKTQTVDAIGALNAYNEAMRELVSHMALWLHRNDGV
jgi:ABC-type uncharacterized transport system auxiliary subunit